MGVYIKGMKMPTSCYGCPFFTQVDYWNKNGEADILSKCKRTGEFTWESVNGYLPNCPLVPVPEHGDLIDRYDLKNKEITIDYDEWDDTFEDGLLFVADLIDNAPTIIPADKEE